MRSLHAVAAGCSLSGGVGQEEKTADEYDYLDESNEAGPCDEGRGPSAVDRACLACRRCCGPCCSCSTRFQLALLSSLGFCISFGIRCNMGVAVLQMTSNVTQRYAVSPLLPGANVTIELVRSRSLVAHADYVSRHRQDFRVRLFVRLFVCLFVRSITQKRMIPKCSNSVYGMTLGYTRSDVLLGLKG